MTNDIDIQSALRAAIAEHDGILPLDAALVARDWIAAGRRLGLPESMVDVGERGEISERWLASTTKADNRVGPDDEGISYVRTSAGDRWDLREVLRLVPQEVLGAEYAREHQGLGRLAKIYDFATRIPMHIHPPQSQADKVGLRSKDEASYFPAGVDRGAHPESFFGLIPTDDIEGLRSRMLELLVEWDTDEILSLSPAYLDVPEAGFYTPSGVLHAPGTALTIEIQEDSDTLAMLQGINSGRPVRKDLLFKDVSEHERLARGEAALLEWIDWAENLDAHFFERHRILPRRIVAEAGAEESWILYGSQKFSGKRLSLEPGASFTSQENGVFSLLVWRGEGRIAGRPVRANSLSDDELLVVHDRAVQPMVYENTGTEPMIVIKFFGPGINPDSPSAA